MIAAIVLAACPAGGSAFAEDPSSVRVAGIVLKWLRADKEANYRRAELLIREAAKNGAKDANEHEQRALVTPPAVGDAHAHLPASSPLSAIDSSAERHRAGSFDRSASAAMRATLRADASRARRCRAAADSPRV